MTIRELESRFEEALAKLPSPLAEGHRAHVTLIDKRGRKKRRNASAHTWSPASGEVRISFEPAKAVKHPRAVVHDKTPDIVRDLIQALDRAEQSPGYGFIALKWFRDVFLPGEGFEWGQSADVRQNVLRTAIDRRLILISKVANPRSPQFPVTAVRLNRTNAEVRETLGEGLARSSDFDPIEIRGEPLSATILRERR